MTFSKRFRKIWNAAASLTTKGVPPPPLSYQQALEFFDQLAARTDLALGYPQEACFARNHLMCETALQAGYMPQKAWAVDQESAWAITQQKALDGNQQSEAHADEEPEGAMTFTTPDGEKIRYWAHTAMVLPVKTPSGEILDLVFDPALLDGPVPLEEWGKIINAPFYFLEIKRLGKPPTNFYGDYNTNVRTSKALSDPNHARHPLKTIRRYQPFETIPRTVFASQFCRDHLFPALGQWPERQGKGWISVDPFPKSPARPTPSSPSGTQSGEPKTGG